jgi:hypothetical protein
MKTFTFWRNAIVAETYIFEAESEEKAREMLQSGEVDVFTEEWIDWASDDYQLEHVEDELVTFIKSKELT